jgi:hypothetical protein
MPFNFGNTKNLPSLPRRQAGFSRRGIKGVVIRKYFDLFQILLNFHHHSGNIFIYFIVPKS